MSVLVHDAWDWPLYRRLIALLAALTLIAGCASRPKSADEGWSAGNNQEVERIDEENDPLELLNRFVFSFNLALDTVIFKPAAATYRFLLPTPCLFWYTTPGIGHSIVV